MILAVAWPKEHELIVQEVVWYKPRWDRGAVLENDKAKLVWDFELNQRETTTSRRRDLILEMKNDGKILICAWLSHGLPRPCNKISMRRGRKS